MKDKIKLIIFLIFIGISVSALGWFIGQIVKDTMEVGG